MWSFREASDLKCGLSTTSKSCNRSNDMIIVIFYRNQVIWCVSCVFVVSFVRRGCLFGLSSFLRVSGRSLRRYAYRHSWTDRYIFHRNISQIPPAPIWLAEMLFWITWELKKVARSLAKSLFMSKLGIICSIWQHRRKGFLFKRILGFVSQQ